MIRIVSGTENSDNGFEMPATDDDFDPRIDKLKAIVRILEDSTLASLEYEDEDIEVRLSRYPDGQVTAPAVSVDAPAVVPTAPPAPSAATDDGHVIKSPFVGTFYRSPSPDADPFVEVGTAVEPEQALCIIEAMKLMNHIESDVRGVVCEVLAENGKPVEFGQPLFKISVAS